MQLVKRISAMTLGALVLFGTSVRAEDAAGGGSCQVNASMTAGRSNFGVGKATEPSIQLGTVYRHKLSDLIQIEAPLEFSWVGGDTKTTALAIGVGPVFNFEGDIKNSIFVGLDALFNYNKTGSSDSNGFSLKTHAGKRFEIVANVSYEPALWYIYNFAKSAKSDRNDVGIDFISLTATF